MNIKTVGQLRKLIAKLDDDYTIDFRVRVPLTEEEKLSMIGFPVGYRTIYTDKAIELDDIGVSDKQLCLSIGI